MATWRDAHHWYDAHDVIKHCREYGGAVLHRPSLSIDDHDMDHPQNCFCSTMTITMKDLTAMTVGELQRRLDEFQALQ